MVALRFRGEVSLESENGRICFLFEELGREMGVREDNE